MSGPGHTFADPLLSVIEKVLGFYFAWAASVSMYLKETRLVGKLYAGEANL